MRVKLPILTLNLREQRYSCHGCGNCCRDFTVQLRPEDRAKLESQQWEQKLGQPVTIGFRGQTFLRQRENGACIFLMEDGLCRIHKEYGFAAKPIACQLFPFHLIPKSTGGAGMGINFACQSVLENKGAELASHKDELKRMASALAELDSPAAPPMLTDRLRASAKEEQTLIEHVDKWLSDDEISLPVRIDGLAWVAAALAQARLENVRDDRFTDLLDVLFGALPEELQHHPVSPPTSRQRKMLRQAVFARTEDPKINVIQNMGRWRIMWSQLMRSRRFKQGRGLAPKIGEGWADNARLEEVETIDAASPALNDVDEKYIDLLRRHPIDDLLTRYLRATMLGGRAWGAGYYGWPMIAGLQAMLLNVACLGWLARLHAVSEKSKGSSVQAANESLDLADVRAALGRIDRTSGRAKWLGGRAERLRLAYLEMDDGLRRLLAAYALLGE